MTKQAYIESSINALLHEWIDRTLIVGSIAIILLIGLDYFVAPAQFMLFLKYRIVAALSLFAVFLFNRRKISKKRNHVSAFLGAVIGSVMITLMIQQLDGHQSPYFAGIMLLLIYVIGFNPLSAAMSSVLSLIVYAFYVIPILLYDTITNPAYFINANFFIVAIICSLIFLRHLHHVRLVSEMGMQYDLNEQKEQLRAYSTQLEDQVKERTAELTEMVKNMQHEIAERKTTELAFRESEERFREIFEQNEDALLILDHSTGGIMDVNPAANDIFGYTRQDLISEGLSLILMTEEQEQFMSEMRGGDASGRFRIAQIRCRKKDGTAIITSIRGKAVQLKRSEVLLCSFRNITERRRLEEEAKLLQAKLIQMNKMSSLGMLVTGIAHEINNPNHFIMVNARMVSDAWKDAANVLSVHYHEHGDFPLGGVPFSEMRYIIPQLLMAMSDGSDRIKNIVEDLKDFSKQSRAALDQGVDVNRVLAASVGLLKNQIGKFTDNFQLSEGVDLPLVKGNKQQIEQVVINLLMNALQSLRDRNSRVTVLSCLEKESDSILIQIKDEGIGISQELLSHITEPFYTTRLEEGGTGLGLWISFSIIKDHQGTLTFLSEPGKGTIATISLPAYQSSTERNRHATDPIS